MQLEFVLHLFDVDGLWGTSASVVFLCRVRICSVGLILDL